MAFLKRDNLAKKVRYCALGRPGEDVALRNLQNLRAAKMDKPCLAMISLQKSGSTLLSYCCALLNTGNAIRDFRNDFDLIPMLSFPTRIIPQNFNARQDGVYQMYKINGHLERMIGPLVEKAGIRRVIWMCREFSGYYASVYRWLISFYPRANPELAALSGLNWERYKAMTLEAMVHDHVEELWTAFQHANSAGKDSVFLLAYEQLTGAKESTLARIADWLKLPHDLDMLRSIADKTSKESMIKGERFDPLAFGEGGGVSKVNLDSHLHFLSDDEQSLYDQRFRDRFKAAGIGSYRILVNAFPGVAGGC
jgi:hypothetical protein